MATDTKTTKKKKINVFHQRIGSLTFYQACQLLGDEGSKLIQAGGRTFEIQSDRDVFLGGDLYRVRVQDSLVDGGLAVDRHRLRVGVRDLVQVPVQRVGPEVVIATVHVVVTVEREVLDPFLFLLVAGQAFGLEHGVVHELLI